MTDQYIKVPTSILVDKTLSLKAKGLYALILSFPSSWTCSIQYLVEEAKESKHCIRSAIQELEIHGYLERRQLLDEHGCFWGMEYELKVRECDDTK